MKNSRSKPTSPLAKAGTAARLKPDQNADAIGPRWPGWLLGLLGLIVVLAVAVRVTAARDEMWFDEVWSLLKFGLAISNPGEVFTFHHDNNHHLITLWMAACGLQKEWIVYRLPSVLAGVGTVILAAQFARRWGVWETLLASLLTGGSFLLVTYASEARGYALAGFFVLAAWLALERFAATRSLASSALFCAAVVLGFLSHLTFLFFYAGAVAWSVVALRPTANRRTGSDNQPWWLAMARCHAAPLLFLVVFYLFDVRGLMIAGGPGYSLLNVLTETLVLPWGRLSHETLDQVLMAFSLAMAGAGLFLLWKSRSPLTVLMAVTIFLGPGLLLLVQRPEQLYPRYFYIPAIFYLLLASFVLGRLTRQGRPGQAAVVVIMVATLATNGVQIYRLLSTGRGQTLAALRYMAEQSAGGPISMQSDHDFESQAMLSFYVHYMSPETRLRYTLQGDPSPATPEWTVVYGQGDDFTPHPTIADGRGRPYQLDRVFPAFGLSGYQMAIYRQIGGGEGDARGGSR